MHAVVTGVLASRNRAISPPEGGFGFYLIAQASPFGGGTYAVSVLTSSGYQEIEPSPIETEAMVQAWSTIVTPSPFFNIDLLEAGEWTLTSAQSFSSSSGSAIIVSNDVPLGDTTVVVAPADGHLCQVLLKTRATATLRYTSQTIGPVTALMFFTVVDEDGTRIYRLMGPIPGALEPVFTLSRLT